MHRERFEIALQRQSWGIFRMYQKKSPGEIPREIRVGGKISPLEPEKRALSSHSIDEGRWLRESGSNGLC